MKKSISLYIWMCLFLVLSCLPAFAQSTQPPTLTATGNQVYCPGTPVNIVTSFSLQPAPGGPTSGQAVYIQISAGYSLGDILSLSSPVTNVTTSWNSTSGKLTISGVGGQDVPFTTLEQAVDNVVFNTTAPNPSGTRSFSITIGDANYLASTQHYYRFVSQVGIYWSAAKIAAAADSYYGLQGYLATLTSAEEAHLCGEQATGTGWIGGSDEQTEGIWKWMTGPEAGLTFWNGGANGSTPNFAFWNTGEPNNSGAGENYAHITAPGVGVLGSWNDLPDAGSSGSYVPKGYIVEYGGMPGDPTLNISANTTITIPQITSTTTPVPVCGSGTAQLSAVSDNGNVYWYDAPTGGNQLASTPTFTTPVISQPTTYYASAYDATCTTATRTAVTATINAIPTATATATTVNACGSDNPVLEATASAGTISWYAAPTGGTAIGSGSPFAAPPVTGTATFYAEATSNGCVSATRAAVTVNHFDNPVVPADDDVDFCENKSVTLDATMANVTYLWSSGETTATIDVTQGGTYTVEVTNPAQCTATRTFNVTELPMPHISDVRITLDSAEAIMLYNDPENYEYSLDSGPFQDSTVFNNLVSGQHTIYANSLIGCGLDHYTFVIYLIPKFFTPNGDNTNDFFTLAGMGALPLATVTIFDRYGKLITRLDRQNRTWDGSFNGYPLPATDYWYVITIDDKTPAIRGHFSLLR